MNPDGTARPPTLDPHAITSLLELVGDDRDALAEIVDAFLEEAPRRLAELRSGLETSDAVVARRSAHTLKSNALTFGAGDLARVCEEIEAAARDGDLAPGRARIDDVDGMWIGVRDELVSLRGSTAE
jgi:HPt (histidine-containing phosphotransfer) domain-containing protein